MAIELPQIDSLDGKLSSTPIPKPLRRKIINGIFRICLTEQQFDALGGLDTYFCDWYEEQCEVAAGHVSITTHCELLNIINLLQSTDSRRYNIIDALPQSRHWRQHASTTEELKLSIASIDLAARIWLSVSIGSIERALTPGNIVVWDDGETLSESLLRAVWPQSQLNENVKLPRTFTAANLERIAGLKVKWTSNLADHLALREDDTTVMLFHQASFLELHGNTGQ